MPPGPRPTGVSLAIVVVVAAAVLGAAPPSVAAPRAAGGGFSATALPVAGRVVTPKTAGPTSVSAAAGSAPAATLAADGPEGVPTVAPGLSPAGYLPLDLFGIAPTPIGDEDLITLNTPPFVFANQTYTSFAVDSNGYIKAGSTSSADNVCCSLPSGPDPAPPNAIIAPFWTDLDGTAATGIFAGTLTDGVNSWIVVEWRVNVFGTTSQRVFQVWIGINGVEDISMVYDPSPLPADPNNGQAFLVGAENSVGQGGLTATLPTQDLRVTSTVPVVAASVQPVSGGGQAAESGEPFANPLVTSVTGTDGLPFAGATVTYTVTAGAASFGGSATATATTDSAGLATSPVLGAGATAGPVTVTASAPYATSAAFGLTVTRTAAAITPVSGGGQSTAVGLPFALPLVAGVTARDRQPLSGAPVTFTVDSGRATFGGAASATVATGADGRATAPTLTAGNGTGAVTVTATTPGVTQGAVFTLTVTSAAADLSAALAGPAGSVRPGTVFTVTLTVRNAGPSTATTVASGIFLPAGLRIVSGGGGAVSRDGRTVGFLRSGITAGQSITYTLTVTANGADGARTITAATASFTRDPAYANNVSRTVVTVRR